MFWIYVVEARMFGLFWKRSMTSRDVSNIHDSNARLGVSDIHTRMEISIRYAAHKLSYINATGARLVCMAPNMHAYILA